MKRRSAALLLAVLSLLPVTGSAQAKIAPPSSGLLMNYQYWPVQYVQWIGPELPYAMIELDVDSTGKQPLLQVTLTERATGKRTVYTNSAALATAAKAQDEDAYKTEIAYQEPDAENVGSTSGVRFTMADGKPLQWSFVQGSDVSEQGSGLSPIPDAKVPVFAYREEGAVAGEGTALQIGDTVSTAAVWTEISHPPYFVAYRGAMTHSAHKLVFAAGSEAWTVASAPTSLAVGSTWELDGANGEHRTLRVDRAAGANYVISGTDTFHSSVRFTLEVVRAGETWNVERISYAPVKDGDKHFLTLQFGRAPASATGKTDLILLAGKKKTLATGTLTITGTADDGTLTLEFATPAWVRGKSIVAETTSSADGLKTVARP